MLIDPTQATLLVVDIQEKLIGSMSDPDGLLARTRWLLAACTDLALPMVISEQYPQGLGPTVASLKAVAPQAEVVEKVHFSCVAGDCLPATLLARQHVIVCGMETHVCVLQTVMDLLALGKTVFVVEDACDSRRMENKQLGLARMRHAGAQIVTREMVLFEVLGSSAHPAFRYISKTYLVGEQP